MRVFVDTNVLVYAKDSSEPEKQARAEQWVSHLWTTRSGRLSAQVFEEYYVTVTRQLTPGIARDAARADIRDLLSWRPLALDHTVITKAWALEDRFQLSFWDAMIVSAATLMDCKILLTEDLQHGQKFEDVEVVDPFAVSPVEFSAKADKGTL